MNFNYCLILECWKYESEERPNIQKVVSTLKTMISLKQNDMITLQNQKFLQSDIMDSVNNSSSAIVRITDWNQEVVENGDIDAQYNLAQKYYKEKNLEKAFYWCQKAAENGNIDVQNTLGVLYENGDGTEKNLEKAFYWYQKASENGNIEAQKNLGILYQNGFGTEKNLKKAFYWYQKAAEYGNIDAQNNLGWLYENGEGTEKNLEKAFYWYQ